MSAECFRMTARQVNESKKVVMAEENEIMRSMAEEKKKTRNLGCTMSLKKAHLATSIGNNFLSPNQPEVIRAYKGMPIVGIR